MVHFLVWSGYITIMLVILAGYYFFMFWKWYPEVWGKIRRRLSAKAPPADPAAGPAEAPAASQEKQG